MRRFIVDSGEPLCGRLELTGDLFRHIATVLRLDQGDDFILTDGKGSEAVASIIAIEEKSLVVELEPLPTTGSADSALIITIYQGLPKGDKLESVMQKCTELGISRLVVFAAERSIVKLDADRLQAKTARWQKIATEAARQSGRSRVPLVEFAADLQSALRADSSDLKLLLWEEEGQQRLKPLLAGAQPASAAVVVGPEGGLSRTEAATVQAAGFIPITLGRRILRTETAAPAITAILQYSCGDMG
ncbi:MAG: 16S rRNA (uracil(1498)-N(3))-methyltransferase [Geobacter sp.]|nr:16S rRNA (uracil(1498)-N(3))-methyltransferase [Geobacter sp.]